MSWLFHSGVLLGAEQGAAAPSGGDWLLVEGGVIAALGAGGAYPRAGRCVHLAGRILAPGLIDVHTHGALGCDTMDATPDALEAMAGFYASHGVTAFLATTMTAPHEEIMAALRNIRAVRAEGSRGAHLLGAHVEGPYVDVERRGCQDASHVRRADPAEYRDLFDSGVVRLITLAPEYPENQALIGYAVGREAVVSLGHSRAPYDAVCRAVELGARQVTHLFNGMEPLHHRVPGLVGAALDVPMLTCQLIADNIHIDPAVLRLAARLKGSEGIILITDAMSATGMPDGDYVLGNVAVTVRGGVSRTADGVLAGSTLTLERAVANMRAATGWPLESVWSMASTVPARCLGMAERKGRLRVGMDADLVILDDDLSVALTMVGGEVVYCRQPASIDLG